MSIIFLDYDDLNIFLNDIYYELKNNSNKKLSDIEDYDLNDDKNKYWYFNEYDEQYCTVIETEEIIKIINESKNYCIFEKKFCDLIDDNYYDIIFENDEFEENYDN